MLCERIAEQTSLLGEYSKNPKQLLKKNHFGFPYLLLRRATDGARTRDLHLGKVAYYQLYYCRICLSPYVSATKFMIAQDKKNCKHFFEKVKKFDFDFPFSMQ